MRRVGSYPVSADPLADPFCKAPVVRGVVLGCSKHISSAQRLTCF